MNACQPLLLVEDEKDIRETMVLLLEDEGYTVYTAAHGKEAWDVLRDPLRVRPGLIALDFYMPVMDACAFLDILAEARRQGQYPDLAVILVTAAADVHARAELEGKVQGVLKKPIDIEAFLQLVEKYCGKPAVPVRS